MEDNQYWVVDKGFTTESFVAKPGDVESISGVGVSTSVNYADNVVYTFTFKCDRVPIGGLLVVEIPEEVGVDSLAIDCKKFQCTLH